MTNTIASKTNLAQPNPQPCWYLLASRPQQEFRAVEQLNNQQIKAFCPKIKVEKIRRDKKCVVEEALFKSYIFVCIALDSPHWHKIRSTRGVRDWVRFGGEIAKLPSQLVQELIELEQNAQALPFVSRFQQGEKVRILSGPFAGLKAIYQKDDGDARSLILVEFLGQTNRLKINNGQITND